MPGTITFRPVEANLTHDTDWLGKMDPYVMFSIGTQRVKSSICKHGGTRPHWGDTVTLQTPDGTAPSVAHLEVFDKDRFRPDDSIAAADIDLSELQSRGSVSRWYPLYHHRKLAGEILVEATYQSGQQQFVQQPVLAQTFVPTETYVQETVVTSGPIISNTTYSGLNQGLPMELGQQQYIGQSYETSSNYIGGQSFGGQPLGGQSFGGLPLGSQLQGGLPLGQQANTNYYNDTNATGLLNNNAGLPGANTGIFLGNNAGLQGNNAGLQDPNTTGTAGTQGKHHHHFFHRHHKDTDNNSNAGTLASKTSALGPQGGFSHGNHTLHGATNAGYSERPGYTLGHVESNPTTQSNLDTNGGGLFNKPGRERRAEPYSLSNPGTYGIPHGQTIDTSGHLRPDVGLAKQAPIGQINQPGVTGYPDNYSVGAGVKNQGLVGNNLSGGLGQQGYSQGGLGGSDFGYGAGQQGLNQGSFGSNFGSGLGQQGYSQGGLSGSDFGSGLGQQGLNQGSLGSNFGSGLGQQGLNQGNLASGNLSSGLGQQGFNQGGIGGGRTNY